MKSIVPSAESLVQPVSLTAEQALQQAIRTALEHHRADRLPEAEHIYRHILKIEPNNPHALHLLGLIAHKVGQNEIAVQLINKAIFHLPSDPAFSNSLGEANLSLGRPEEALVSYDQALSINPDFVEALYNRGNALHALRRDDEALASYERALSIKPDYVEALVNRGVALQHLKRYGEALANYEKALLLKPNFALAHWNESLCRLLLGDFELGFAKYEWRHECAEFSSATRNFVQPLWLGKEEIEDKTILLHAEQGLGDSIQFIRYAQAVAQRGAKVILEVPLTLKTLLPDVPGTYEVIAKGEQLPAFDFHCPLLSLPFAFSTRIETIPATNPYLSVRKSAVSAWRRRLAVKRRLLVGLCWRGSPNHKYDRDRSLKLNEFLPLLVVPNVQFISLQKEVNQEERALTDSLENFIHFGENFQDTAEMIGALDLVISVDTVWAHWAGALGIPVWILLASSPDWRWMTNRDDSPWYPTARLFRQSKSSDWQSAMENVQRALVEFPK